MGLHADAMGDVGDEGGDEGDDGEQPPPTLLLRLSAVVRTKRVAARLKNKVRRARISHCVHAVGAGLASSRFEED